MSRDETGKNTICVAAMYLFAELPDEQNFIEGAATAIDDKMQALGIRGTMILATEGINGTVAGPQQSLDAFLVYLRSKSLLDGKLFDLNPLLSFCKEMPFERAVVKVRPEIVTMGVPEVCPSELAGQYVDPEDWNELVNDPNVLVLDTRNDFEVEMGTFVSADGRRALNPQTVSFRDFPDFAASQLPTDKDKTVAMFCTGGIRCEKATSYLLKLGYRDVRHLKGGILGYLRKIDASDSCWDGDCFVFDNRVALCHGLKPVASRAAQPDSPELSL